MYSSIIYVQSVLPMLTSDDMGCLAGLARPPCGPGICPPADSGYYYCLQREYQKKPFSIPRAEKTTSEFVATEFCAVTADSCKEILLRDRIISINVECMYIDPFHLSELFVIVRNQVK